MDWDPSAPATPRRTQSQHAPAAAQSGKPARSGARPVATGMQATEVAAAVAPSPDTSHDPWGRAVEQAPGIWVVGSEPNVGKGPARSTPDEAVATPAPEYEPAAAQIPRASAGTPSEADASWGLPPASSSRPSDHSAAEPNAAEKSAADISASVVGDREVPPVSVAGAGNPASSAAIPAARASSPAVPAPQGPAPEGAAPGGAAREHGGSGSQVPAPDREAFIPERAEVREYAMASAAPAPAQTPAVAPAALQPAPATSASAAEARQSLYQRLSNSPEAEAGRAKAPARVAAATYVQDIPSADDETIEESGVFGRAAVERILGGKLIEERSPDGTPIVPRF
jgi:DNA polymerase III subunit gamma/tau